MARLISSSRRLKIAAIESNKAVAQAEQGSGRRSRGQGSSGYDQTMNVPESANVWKWICGIMLALLVGTVSGEFLPNRNIATTDQIQRVQSATTAQVAGVQTSVAALTVTVQSLSDEVSELRGELKGRNMLEDK